MQRLHSLCLLACWSFGGVLHAQEVVTPDDEGDIAALTARFAERLDSKNIKETGSPVLRTEYFLDAYSQYRPYPAESTEVAGGFIRLRDGNQMHIADAVAGAMLEVANLELPTGARYQEEWAARLQTLAPKLKDNANLTLKQIAVWFDFLEQWKKDVVKADLSRFRDALRQAAYSILRLAIGTEQSQIDKVAKDRVAGGTATTTGERTRSGGYHHYDVRHERMMSAIYRRHDRRTYRITRITARR